jgi:putative tricarboxylic transport membrane protein
MRSDVYTGTFVCVLSIFMYYTAHKLPEGMFGTLGAGFFPRIIFGTLAVLSFVLVLQSIFIHFVKKTGEEKTESFSPERYRYVIIAFVFFFLFVLVLKYFGFVFASLFFLPTLMWILGPKTKASLVPISLTSIGMTAIIYLSFTKLLQVFLPSGSFF